MLLKNADGTSTLSRFERLKFSVSLAVNCSSGVRVIIRCESITSLARVSNTFFVIVISKGPVSFRGVIMGAMSQTLDRCTEEEKSKYSDQ